MKQIITTLYSAQWYLKIGNVKGPKRSGKLLIPIDYNKSHLYIVMPKIASIKFV